MTGRRERVLIGEIYLPVERLMHYYGRERPGVHLPFNFQLIDAPWDARALGDADRRLRGGAAARAAGPTGCSAITTGRASPRSVGEAQARVAAMLLLTLRGTPTLYYGDELGIGRRRDPGRRRSRIRASCASPASASAAIRCARRCRGTHAPHAGFSTADAVAAAQRRLADAQCRGPGATTPDRCWRSTGALLALRRAHPALAIGDYRAVEAEGDVLAYERAAGGERLLVALNLGGLPQQLALPAGRRGCLLI